MYHKYNPSGIWIYPTTINGPLDNKENYCRHGLKQGWCTNGTPEDILEFRNQCPTTCLCNDSRGNKKYVNKDLGGGNWKIIEEHADMTEAEAIAYMIGNKYSIVVFAWNKYILKIQYQTGQPLR